MLRLAPDQACVFLDHGLLHRELLFETTNEFHIVCHRIRLFISSIRAYLKNPRLFEALETYANAYEVRGERRTPGYVAAMLQAMRPSGVANQKAG